MKCKEKEEKIINYLIGEIQSEEEKTEILNHIKECEECKQFFNEMQMTINYTKEMYLYKKTKFDIYKIEKKIKRGKILKDFIFGGAIAAAIIFALFIIPYFQNIIKKGVIMNNYNLYSDASLSDNYNNEVYFENKFDNLEEHILLIKENFNE